MKHSIVGCLLALSASAVLAGTTVSPNSVPEPGTLALLAVAVGAGLIGRKRKK